MKIMKRATLAATAAVFVAVPVISSAVVLGPGSVVSGDANSTIPIATQIGLESATAFIESSMAAGFTGVGTEIANVGQGIMTGQAKMLGAYQKIEEAKNQEQHERQVQGLAAKDALKAKDTYLAPGSTPSMACGAAAIGGAIRVGDEANRAGKVNTAKQVANKSQSYSKAIQISRDWVTAPAASTDSSALVPPAGGAIQPGSQADMNATLYISHLLHPDPVTQLSSNDKAMLAKVRAHPDQVPATASDYIRLRKQYRSAISPAEHVMAAIKQQNMATLPVGDWATAQWQSMGEKGTPPGVVDGKMSTNSLLNLQVDARYGNPIFYNKVSDLDNSVGLARERTLMMSTVLKQNQMIIRYLRQLTLMRGANYAQRVNQQYTPKLRQARESAASWLHGESATGS